MERRLNEVDWTPTELSQRAEEFQTGLLEKDRLIQTLESEVEQQVMIKLIRYKIFHNDTNTIRYRIDYLKVGIFVINTKFF